MVIFFFSGACAAAPNATIAPSASAASARTNRFMFISSFPSRRSESNAGLRRYRRVAGHLLELHGEVHGDEIDVEAAEDAALVEPLLGEPRRVRLGHHPHRSGAEI